MQERTYKTKPKGITQKVNIDYATRQKLVLHISQDSHNKLIGINALIASKSKGKCLTFSGLVELFILHYTDDMIVHIAKGE